MFMLLLMSLWGQSRRNNMLYIKLLYSFNCMFMFLVLSVWRWPLWNKMLYTKLLWGWNSVLLHMSFWRLPRWFDMQPFSRLFC